MMTLKSAYNILKVPGLQKNSRLVDSLEKEYGEYYVS